MHNEHDRERRRYAEHKRRWRRRRLKSYAINAGIIAAAVAVVLLLDYLVSLRAEPEIMVSPSDQVITQTTTTQENDPVVMEPMSFALPQKTYSFVGQPITYYFLNLTGFNSLEGLEIQVDTDGKGTVYKDRWEYTPKKEETVTFNFKALNKNGVAVSKGTCIIEVKKPNKKEELTVLVIGDGTISSGYETEYLMEMAEQDDYNLKLLGTQITPYMNNADNKHEGRNGWRSAHYAETSGLDNIINPFYNPTTQEFDFLYYMEDQWYADVDCVCIQVGLNDMFGTVTDNGLMNTTIPKYLENIQAIIESIHKYDPQIKVLWHLILPGSTDQSKFESAYGMSQTAERYKRNTYLTNLEILKLAASMENVYVVPTNAVLNVDGMAAGGHGALHPSKDGYRELATVLYSYLRAIN